jgi:uncharacterized protein YdeI (YjbR/CyaY-like superfamily)
MARMLATPRKAAAPTFFATAAEFGAWLATHHATAGELLVGFHTVGSGVPCMTWPESVDEALCVGWIDGIRRRVDATRYTIRFTPRRAGSTWSRVNLQKVEALVAAGRMRPAGIAAWEARRLPTGGGYSYETRPAEMPEPYAATFRRAKRAWAFFERQPAGYRRTATWFVVSAKQEATRTRRLVRLIAHSAKGERLPQFTPTPPTGPNRTAPAKPKPTRPRRSA